MIDRPPSFGPDELPSSVGAAELATSLAMGRELEALEAPSAAVSGAFADRVMAAVSLEPVPQPTTVAGQALRTGKAATFLAALADAWRVASSGGRPLAVRAQAMALVLVAVLAIGTLLSAGAVGVAGALGLFRGATPPVAPIESPEASVSPSPSLAPSPSLSEAPVVVPSPSPAESGEPGETEEPDKTEDPTDDSSGPGGGGGSDNSGSGSGNSGSGSNDGGSDNSGSGSGSSNSGSGGDDSPDDDSSGHGPGSGG